MLEIVTEKGVEMREEEGGKRGRENEMTNLTTRTTMMTKCRGMPRKSKYDSAEH